MKIDLKKILTLVGDKKKELPIILILSFFSTGLELLGLSLIIPFITALKSPEILFAHEWWQPIASTFGIEKW